MLSTKRIACTIFLISSYTFGMPYTTGMNPIPYLQSSFSKVKPTLAKHKLAIAATSACLGVLYYWLRTPLKVDTRIQKLNILSFSPTNNPQGENKTIEQVCSAIQKGTCDQNNNTHIHINNHTFNLSNTIPSQANQTMFIYVSGYAGMSGNARYKYAGAGAHATYKYIQRGCMENAPCISFDGQVNDRRSFNFGQKLDQDCLNQVYQETIKRNPQSNVVLVGSCKGATTILNYLSHTNNNNDQFKNIKAVILESPSISLEALTNHVARSHIPTILQGLLPKLFKIVFPNYSWNQPTILDNANNFPATIPVFIGCSTTDKVASYQDIVTIEKRLRESNVPVQLFQHTDPQIKHGQLSNVTQYQQAIKTFLNRSVLPHQQTPQAILQ
jgi:hypothetical protein